MRPLRLTRLAVLLLALPLLAGCLGGGRLLASLPADAEWIVFPVERWYARERGEPEGLVACIDAACPNRLMVGVVRLRGEAAREARRALDDPRRLAAFLLAQDRDDEIEVRRAIRTLVDVRPLEAGGLTGFAVVITGEGPRAGRTAHGAALARVDGTELQIALSIGDDADAVEAAVRQIARETLR